MIWPQEPEPAWMAEIPEDKRATAKESWLGLTEGSRLETAMCLWEAVLDDMARDKESRWEKARDREGSANLRYGVAQMVAACEFGWILLAPDPGRDGERVWSYDFEYVPLFLATCVVIDPAGVGLRDNWIDLLRAAEALTE